MSGLFKKPSTKPQEKAIEEQRKENERLKIQAEEERRDLGEQAAAKRIARTRGGSRMLLSSARLFPEQGIQTLGSSDITGV